MDLNDLIPEPNSKELSQISKKTFGNAVDITKLTESKAKKLQTKLSNGIIKMQDTYGASVYENKTYNEMALALKAVSKFLAENITQEADVDEDNAFNTAAAKAAVAGDKHFSFNGKKYPVKMSKDQAKKLLDDINEGRMGYSDAEKLGGDVASKIDNALRRKIHAMGKDIRDIERGTLDQMRYGIAKQMGLIKEDFDKVKIGESQLAEGEIEQASLVLAGKDMVDRVQKMVEDISKMINEDLPPLTDAIRDEVDSATADSFGQAMTSALSGLLDQIKVAREATNDAARILSGEEPAGEMMGAEEPSEVEDPDAEMGAEEVPAEEASEETTDDFEASDAAVGGEEPAGRAKQ